MTTEALTVVDADIDRLRAALEVGELTSVELVARYLNRIAAYDRSGIRLNSVPVLDPRAFAAARASDLRRAQGARSAPSTASPSPRRTATASRACPWHPGPPPSAT